MDLGPFSDLPAPDRQRLAALASTRTWARGEVLFRAGDVATTVLIVRRGVLGVATPVAGGHEVVLAVEGPGAVLGELGVAGARRRSATVAGFEAGAAAELALDALAACARRSPAVAEVCMGVMRGTIRRLTTQLAEAHHVPQPVRLRSLLLRLDRLYDGPITLTQDQLAQLVGARRTTVSALLAADARAGLLTLRRGSVEIRDAAELRRLAA